jgi:hypothetical protein
MAAKDSVFGVQRMLDSRQAIHSPGIVGGFLSLRDARLTT